MIEQMSVECLNKENSCNWKGNLEELKKHLGNDCQYVEMKCENLGCEEKI